MFDILYLDEYKYIGNLFVNNDKFEITTIMWMIDITNNNQYKGYNYFCIVYIYDNRLYLYLY